MAKFKLELDKRVPLRDGKFNLAIRVIEGKQVMFLNIQKLTQQQYDFVFVDKSSDDKSIAFRKKCNDYITKCEVIYSKMKVFDREKFRNLFYNKEESDQSSENTLLVSELFKKYVESSTNKRSTKDHYLMVGRILETFQPGLTIADVTPDMLRRLEKYILASGDSLATVFSYNRNLRRIIRYFAYEDKIISESYEYPYGRGRYVIGSYFPKKQVLTASELQQVLDFKNFDRNDLKIKELMKVDPLVKEMARKDLEYARDIWALSFYMNGMNIGDLLWLRKSDVGESYIHYLRRKTLTTRKNNITPITVPVTDEIKRLIKRVDHPDSEFVLGLVSADYSDMQYKNKFRKIRKKLNEKLGLISQYLNLSVPLKMETARDCYASTLLRNGVSKDNISVMMGHSNSVVTEHYLASIDLEKTFDINRVLPKPSEPKDEKDEEKI